MNDDLLREYLKKIEEVWAPEMLKTYSTIVYVDALIGLVWAGVFIIGILTSVYFFRKHVPLANWDDTSDGDAIISIISVIVGAFCAFFLLLNVLDVWMWVALFNPDLAAARMLLRQLLNR